jgi:hypothetical protein
MDSAIMDIQLNFINQSNDANNSDVVIFQRNAATNLGEVAVAWLVIRNCGQGDNHPFAYPSYMAVGASDSFGNYSPHLPASYGQLFAMTRTRSGDQLAFVGETTSRAEVQVENRLPTGAINAMIYKSGSLFARKTNISPGELAAFEFKPTIWIGVVSQVEQGQVMDEAIISSIDTEFTLFGLASADIVMTGGGTGQEAKPFEFHLENVVMA